MFFQPSVAISKPIKARTTTATLAAPIAAKSNIAGFGFHAANKVIFINSNLNIPKLTFITDQTTYIMVIPKNFVL
jgi:hypothetical protein